MKGLCAQPIVCILTPFILAVSSVAQSGHAGSGGRLSVGRAVIVAGGTATSPSYTARVTSGESVSTVLAQSPTYVAHGGRVTVIGKLVTPGPVIFGASPASSAIGGGTQITVHGFGFGQPGTAQVQVGGVTASSSMIASNTTLTLTTPVGANTHGNPKGVVDVVLNSPAGSTHRAQLVSYLPALTLENPARVSDLVQIRLSAAPSSMNLILFGLPAPNQVLKLPPFTGALEGMLLVAALPIVHADPTGQLQMVWPVPDNPTLAGGRLAFQALSLQSLNPIAGQFSNLLTMTIQP